MDDLEFLRELFKDTRTHIAIGTITALGLSTTANSLRVKVMLLPENREVIAKYTFSDVDDVTFPEVEDLVLVVFVEGEDDLAYVIKTINTDDEKIPTFALTGNSVRYARPGKKLYLGSSVKVGIGRPNIEPTEPLVLGNVLKTGLEALVKAFTDATQIGQGPTGPVVLDPAVRLALVNFLTTYVNTASSNVVSQVGFTERGV